MTKMTKDELAVLFGVPKAQISPALTIGKVKPDEDGKYDAFDAGMALSETYKTKIKVAQDRVDSLENTRDEILKICERLNEDDGQTV